LQQRLLGLNVTLSFFFDRWARSWNCQLPQRQTIVHLPTVPVVARKRCSFSTQLMNAMSVAQVFRLVRAFHHRSQYLLSLFQALLRMPPASTSALGTKPCPASYSSKHNLPARPWSHSFVRILTCICLLRVKSLEAGHDQLDAVIESLNLGASKMLGGFFPLQVRCCSPTFGGEFCFTLCFLGQVTPGHVCAGEHTSVCLDVSNGPLPWRGTVSSHVPILFNRTWLAHILS